MDYNLKKYYFNNIKKIYNIFIFKIIIFFILFSKLFFTNINLKIKKDKLFNNNIFKISNVTYFINNLFFYIVDIKYSFSLKIGKIKIQYYIAIFDDNKNLIQPSDFILYKGLHIICHMTIINNNINIDSIANIYENKYFSCVELFNYLL